MRGQTVKVKAWVTLDYRCIKARPVQGLYLVTANDRGLNDFKSYPGDLQRVVPCVVTYRIKRRRNRNESVT